MVRAALLLLVLGIIATLVVLDRRRAEDPAATPDPDRAASPTSSVTIEPPLPTGTATGKPGSKGPGKPGKGAPVPTPPPGIEALACQELQRSVRVRVLSFNTHRSYGGIGTVAAEIRSLDPDVVLLQEIDRFHARTGGVDQVDHFSQALGMEAAFSPNVVSGGGQYGTAILSRFDIVDSGRFPLPNAPGGEPRGLQWAGLDVGGQEVRVYNTHLQNAMPRLRDAQARHVAGILAGEQQHTILGGDMNAVPGTATLGALQARLVDAWPVAGDGPAGTAPDGARIDYLLASPALEPQGARTLRSAISDHDGVVVDYVVPSGCPSADGDG